jgi:Fur family ferric uptake transcriptional regulator
MTVIPNITTPRVTTQQQAIFNIIKKSPQHLTAEQVYEQVVKTLPRISLATVYRNLDKLSDSSLISKVTIGGLYYFETELKPHYHVVCLSCKRVDNLDSAPATDIEDFFSRSTSYKLTGHDLVLYGLCPACQKKR